MTKFNIEINANLSDDAVIIVSPLTYYELINCKTLDDTIELMKQKNQVMILKLSSSLIPYPN